MILMCGFPLRSDVRHRLCSVCSVRVCSSIVSVFVSQQIVRLLLSSFFSLGVDRCIASKCACCRLRVRQSVVVIDVVSLLGSPAGGKRWEATAPGRGAESVVTTWQARHRSNRRRYLMANDISPASVEKNQRDKAAEGSGNQLTSESRYGESEKPIL